MTRNSEPLKNKAVKFLALRCTTGCGLYAPPLNKYHPSYYISGYQSRCVWDHQPDASTKELAAAKELRGTAGDGTRAAGPNDAKPRQSHKWDISSP